MTEIQQRAIAQDMHDFPEEWKPKQPDRIEMGTRRYYPARYEAVYDGLSLVVLVVLFLLVAFWP
jgi:hypothetical protein